MDDITPPKVVKPGMSSDDANSEVVTSAPENAASPSNLSGADTTGNSSQAPAAPVVAKQTKPSRKKLLVLAGAAVVLAGATAAYTFAYYLPNKPENIWKSAMTRSAEGYERLVNYAETTQKQKTFDKTEVSGNFKLTSEGTTADGTITGLSDQKNAKMDINVSSPIGKITTNLLMKDAENSEMPDLYFKVSGIKGLGQQFMGTDQLDQLDAQWVAIDHAMIDSAMQQSAQSGSADVKNVDPPKSEDVIAAARVFGEQTKQYIFTTEPGKQAIKMDHFIGKETVDGVQTNHYKAKMEKDHIKDYMKSLGKELDKTNLNKWFKETNGKPISEMLGGEDAMKAVDEFVATDPLFDLWVNTKTKTIQKVKFVDEKNTKNVLELGLNYKGGDDYPFFVNMVFDDKEEGKGNGKLNLNLNTKTNVISMDLKADDADAKKLNLTVAYTMKPTDKSVEVKAPEQSMTLMEAASKSGLAEMFSAMGGSAPYGDQTQVGPYSQSM